MPAHFGPRPRFVVAAALIFMLAAVSGCTVLVPAVVVGTANKWDVRPSARLADVSSGRTVTLGLRNGDKVRGVYLGLRTIGTPPGSGALAASGPQGSTAADSVKVAIMQTPAGSREVPLSDVAWVRTNSALPKLIPAAALGMWLDVLAWRELGRIGWGDN